MESAIVLDKTNPQFGWQQGDVQLLGSAKTTDPYFVWPIVKETRVVAISKAAISPEVFATLTKWQIYQLAAGLPATEETGWSLANDFVTGEQVRWRADSLHEPIYIWIPDAVWTIPDFGAWNQNYKGRKVYIEVTSEAFQYQFQTQYRDVIRYFGESGEYPWFWVIPPNNTVEDIQRYNSEVLARIIEHELDVPWGKINSTWWESLIPQYELSDATQLAAIDKVTAYANIVVAQWEVASPTFAGYTPDDVLAPSERRKVVALFRALNGTAIPADRPYLEIIKQEIAQGVNYSGWLQYSAAHPKGSHYHGDVNVGDLLTVAAFDFVTGGLYSIGEAAINVVNDVINGNFGVASINNFESVMDLGVAAVLRDLGDVTVGSTITQYLRHAIAAAAGIFAAGGIWTREGAEQLLKLGVSTAVTFGGGGGGEGGVGLPQPSTVANPGGTPYTGNPLGIQNPYYTGGIDPVTGIPVGTVPATADAGSIMAPLAILAGAFLVWK